MPHYAKILIVTMYLCPFSKLCIRKTTLGCLHYVLVLQRVVVMKPKHNSAAPSL